MVIFNSYVKLPEGIPHPYMSKWYGLARSNAQVGAHGLPPVRWVHHGATQYLPTARWSAQDPGGSIGSWDENE